jgi:hypothetical protein
VRERRSKRKKGDEEEEVQAKRGQEERVNE